MGFEDGGGNFRHAKLLIWDTAGQEVFRTFTSNFLRNTQACLLCFDITGRASFRAAATTWIKEMQSSEISLGNVFVVGTKSDLAASRVVSVEEGQDLARTIGAVSYSEISAETGDGIASLFASVARHVFDSTPSTALALAGHRLWLGRKPGGEKCSATC